MHTDDEDDAISSDPLASETLREPTYTVEMKESFYVVHTRSLEAPRPLSFKPGKLRFVGSGLPPKFIGAFEIREAGGMIVADLNDGNVQRLIKNLTMLYTGFQGDQGRLLALSRVLIDELDHLGVIVIGGDKSLSFHAVDSPFAVQFQLDRDINFADNSMYTTVTVQSYNWNDKTNASVDPADIIRGICEQLKGKNAGQGCRFDLQWLR